MHPRYLLSIMAFVPPGLLANNIQVSNVTLTGQNAGSNTYQVQFDISWENSWRTSTLEANYDAAWIFLKFRLDPGQPWNHGAVSTFGHVAPAGSTLQAGLDPGGLFLFRSANGIGNVNFTAVQVQWNYGASGVADNAIIEVRVMAIEMVFIPGGPFVVGDGTTTGIERQFEAGNTGAPFTISSESAITLGGTSPANLSNHDNVDGGGVDDDFNHTTTQSLPGAFPKGVTGFYAMKYECTEGQYVDFLNMLTTTQATARFPNQTGVSGHTIDDNGSAPEIYVTTAPERACSFLTGISMYAYADWSAMRPMTELEYEKVCRGNRPAVANEFAWGSTSIRSTAYSLSNAGATNESVNALGTQGNANYGSTAGTDPRPWRAGIFSGSLVAPDRAAAGAGYYGAMELSGDLVENVITVGSSSGRAYTGSHGDGALSAIGLANVPGWPTTGTPLARRGSAWINSITDRLRVSDRREVNLAITLTGSSSGFRLCRVPL